MGGDTVEEPVHEKMLSILKKANYNVIIPENINSMCCGMMFDSRGNRPAANTKAHAMEDVLEFVLHRLGARAGVADDGHPAVQREILQDILHGMGLGVCSWPVSPAVEHHSTAHAVDVLRDDHIVVCLLQDGQHLLMDRLLHSVPPH